MPAITQVHGNLVPVHTPSNLQLAILADEILGHGLDGIILVSQDYHCRGVITSGWAGDGEPYRVNASNRDFASRIAALVDHPDLDDLWFAGELVVITEGDPLPAIQRLHVKAGIVTYTNGLVVWEPVSSIVRPAHEKLDAKY